MFLMRIFICMVMVKNASVSTLLVVAVVALGLMAFIGFQDGVTGMQMGGGVSPGISYPRVEDSTAYTIHSGIASQSTQGQMVINDNMELSCETAKALHASGHPATQRAKEICAKYGEPII